jgi:glycine C-acetyltransferase
LSGARRLEEMIRALAGAARNTRNVAGESKMKPYQVHLFTDDNKIPDALPSEPWFVYENKRYLNFTVFDCFHRKTSDDLKDAARSIIDVHGIVAVDGNTESLVNLCNAMTELKKVESCFFSIDDMSALYVLFSIFNEKATFFVDRETSPSIIATLQYRNLEYYSHADLKQLGKLMEVRSERVLVIDGMYEWLGSVGLVNDLLKVAESYECVVIANELNSFGFIGRDGRGFVDLFNCYDAVDIEIGSFSRFLGGFGCYIAAKKYLTSKMKEHGTGILSPMPQFMISANLAALSVIRSEKQNKNMHQKLWKGARYMITRLKQFGFKTVSETPIIVVSLKNNEEAGEFTKRLFSHQIIVAQNKERVRICLSIEHSREDLDYCLETFESVGKELGIVKTD